MRIAIYGKNSATANAQTVNALVQQLSAAGAHITICHHLQNLPGLTTGSHISFFTTHTEIADCNYLISIGGDGTLLDATTLVRNTGIPILGLNTGRLGFLTEFSKTELAEAAQALIDKNYSIDSRSLLKVESPENDYDGYPYALNELTVHKKDTTSMITVNVFMNDLLLNSYWADGLIISTPTGSTAYSLSCGGPILTPESENFVITPIAPHNLNVRPLVIPDNCVLRLQVESRSNDFLASLDSRSEGLSTTEDIIVSKANFNINLIRRPSQDFLSTLRNKLMWGLDKRN